MPLDDTTAEIDASLQPIWYSEQTIVDEQRKTAVLEKEEIASIIREQQRSSTLHRTTRSSVASHYSSILEDDLLASQPSLMHKSSTFTIEPEPSAPATTLLNNSEKENLAQDEPMNVSSQPADDSFRTLEHLLGLGSTATVRESPKTNHDTLSLTVVTPTDIINSTRVSARMSLAMKSGSRSVPSSQTMPTMPTIESIDSTIPPSFLADNTTIGDEDISAMDQQTSLPVNNTDGLKDDSNNDDETNFSFELNDFPSDSKDESSMAVPPSPAAVPAPVMVAAMRAPTCADVAYRALIKSRLGGRVSQPIKADSPLAKQSKRGKPNE